MKEIKLTNSERVALVDDEDFEEISKYKWHFHGGRARTTRHDPKKYKETARRSRIVGTYMHRMLLKAGPTDEIDHVDRNPLNNKKSNLRFCTRSQNIQNTPRRAMGSNTYKGVTYRKESGAWRARIVVNGKRLSLGEGRDPKELARLYNAAALKYHGAFAHLNTIEGD